MASGDLNLGGRFDGIAFLCSVEVDMVDDLISVLGEALGFAIRGYGAGCKHQQRKDCSDGLKVHDGRVGYWMSVDQRRF